MIRNVIFDWSGTLADDLPPVLDATNHVMARAGVPTLTLERFRADFCLPFTRFYDQYVPHVPVAQLEEWFHERFRTVQDQVTELPHAREFLHFCRAHRLRTFLLSTVHPDHFRVQAAATGFGVFLDHCYAGVMDKRDKIPEILAVHGLDPEETLFIGDMQHDVDTAKHGGVFSCAVLTGYNRLEQLRASGPDLIVEHLGELQEILAQNGFSVVRRPHGRETAPLSHPICTVGALVRNDAGEVLMIRTDKWSGLWGIPGGKIRFGEPSEDALRREIREETGLETEDIRFVLEQDCIHSKEFYREAHFILLNYVCRARPGQTVRLNEEAQEYRWVRPAEALRLPLNTPTRILLEAVSKPAPAPITEA